MQLNVIRLYVNLSLAGGAVEELPGDSRGGPFTENTLSNAFDVEYVLATKNDGRLIT